MNIFRRMVTTTLAVAGIWLMAVMGLAWSVGVKADVLLYRGQHVYLVPKVLGDRMLLIAAGPEWRHFPDYNRRIDSNGDGRDDFIAIAIGGQDGYGVQIRYRLERDSDSSERLGSWYWAVLTDASGSTVFEQFNN